MTLPDYFWDRWPYFAGKLSWDMTTTQVNSASHPSGVAKSSTSFGWGKGVKVTSAGWQVTLCDLIWHVISRSGVVISITNCYIRFTLLYFTCSIFLVFYSPTGWCCVGELGQWNGWYIHDSLYCDAARPNWYSYLLVILETFFEVCTENVSVNFFVNF